MIEIFNTEVVPWLYEHHYNLALATCVILLGVALFYLAKPETKGVAMGRKQHRIDEQKKVLSHKIVSAIEEERLFRRMTNTEAREWYRKLGASLDIVELIPLRHRIMSRLANGVHEPVPLPVDGDPPWDKEKKEEEESKKTKRRGNMMLG